jgi:hypothetical protein
VVSSLHGLSAYPADDPRFLGMLGMHGAPYTNHATDEADLIIAIGTRFDDRATGTPETFCRNARILHIDIDPRELGKIKPIAFGYADFFPASGPLLQDRLPSRVKVQVVFESAGFRLLTQGSMDQTGRRGPRQICRKAVASSGFDTC